jgi:hypothetical protein
MTATLRDKYLSSGDIRVFVDGQELLLPSQFCTLVESKRGGYAAPHRDAMTLAVPEDFSY